MQVVSFSEAGESFKAVLDRVEADADVTLITRRHAQGAVVMSLDTYNSLMETVHLLPLSRQRRPPAALPGTGRTR